MRFTIASALQSPLLLLTTVLVTGCVMDGDDGEGEEPEVKVATTESALSDSAGIGAFFQNRQSKPPISVDRGVGTVPNVCPSGYTEILGTCWSWSGTAPASCPSGKEMDAGLCYYPCPLGYDGSGPTCWLGSIDLAVCDALYNPGMALSSRDAHRARTFGIGAGLAVGASVSVETGVYYGENGEFGCYTSFCSGVVTDISIEISASFGDFTSVAAIEGDGFDLSVGAGYGVAGYTQSLAFDGGGNVVGFVQQTSLGVGLSPLALGVSTCDTTLTQRRGPLTLNPANAPDPVPGNTFYRIAPNGNLQMSHHAPNGTFDMVNQTIGWEWNAASKVFAAEGGHVYAIMPNGDLRYYHHNTAGGWDNWGTTIGWGWGVFTKVFAGRFGMIYGIEPNGQLWLYRHNSAFQFTSAQVIGWGWNLPIVFGGGEGALYIVAANGDLLYYYHNTNNQWVVAGLKIGTGWGGFATLGSTGNGEIYGVTPAGDLLFYRHDANTVWQTGSGGRIGTGWDFGSAGLIPAQY